MGEGRAGGWAGGRAGGRTGSRAGGQPEGRGDGRAGGRERFEYFQTVVLPAVFGRADVIFPEFGFVKRGSGWVGRKCPAEGSPLGVRGDRVYVGLMRGDYPAGFAVAGGEPVGFLSYIAGNLFATPRGDEFFRAAAELARRAGVEPGPLEGAGAPDPEALRRNRAALDRQRRLQEANERKRSEERIRRARELWDRSTEGHEGVARYLAGRGLSVGADFSRRLRWCQDCPVGDAKKKTAPAVVAAVTVRVARPDGSDGERLVAVHRLFVDATGGAIDQELGKMMLGPVRGGAVRLGAIGRGEEDAEGETPAGRAAPRVVGGTLALCEGIETGCAIRVATGWPVWACLSAGGLLSIDFPAGMVRDGVVSRVVIAGDFDDPTIKDERGRTPLRGQQAAERAAERLIELFPGLHVVSVCPRDWAPREWTQLDEGVAA